MLSKDSQSPRDTQPASQWVYDHITSDNLNGKSMYDDSVVGLETQSSIYGYNDIGNALALQPTPAAIRHGDAAENEGEDVDLVSQDIRADLFPESKRFRPKTPASHGVKRKRLSQMDSPNLQSPSLPVNPFAGHGNDEAPMGLTQLFKTTQAQTSPPIPVSDGLSERPSPDLHSIQRPSTAAPAETPVPLPRSVFKRAVTEPQAIYISMKESQEAREQRQRAIEQGHTPADPAEDDSFYEIDPVVRQKLDRKCIEDLTREQLFGSRSRTQPASPRHTRRRRASQKIENAHSSPIRLRSRRNRAMIISDDSPEEVPAGNITEEETEREEEIEDGHVENDLSEGNKENIEIEVPRTGTRNNFEQDPHRVTQSSPLTHRNMHVIRASQEGVTASNPLVRRSQRRSDHSGSSSQAFGVADSQSSQPLRRAQQRLGPSSSLGSRSIVLQSQISQVPNSSPEHKTVNKKPEDAQNASNEADAQSSEISGGTGKTYPQTSQPEKAEAGPLAPQFSHPASNSSFSASNVPSRLSATTASNERRGPTPENHPSMPSPTSTPRSAPGSASKQSKSTRSGPSTAFETAREYAEDLPSRSQAKSNSQTAKVSPSPEKLQSQSRKCSEGAAAYRRPSTGSDMDKWHFNILDDEDEHDLSMIKVAEQRGWADRLPRRKTRFQKQIPDSDRPTSSLSQAPPSHRSSSPLSDPPSSHKPTSTTSERSNSRIGGYSSPVQPPYSPITVPSSAKASQSPMSARRAASSAKEGVQAKTGASILHSSALQLDPLAGGPFMQDVGKKQEQAPRQVSNQRLSPAPFSHDLPVTASNRVFAYFKGQHAAYYPATCLAVVPGNERRYEVMYDDGNSDIVTPYGIKRLEFHPGDVCKVDMEGERTKSFVILGVADHGDTNEHSPRSSTKASGMQGSSIDNRGHRSVIVAQKQRNDDGEEVLGEERIVSIWRVYFTQTMWASLKDRGFDFTKDEPTHSRLQTPVERASTPSTPSSRARRNKLGSSHLARDTEPSKASGKGLFHNIALSLTNIAGDGKLDDVQSVIKAQGGRLLESGFDDLFDIPELTTNPTSFDDEYPHLQIKRSEMSTGFTCLIADRYCRRAKYIQALALGIPCIATRWITDCVTKSTLLPLSPYLLPSGESSFLGGAVRSRILDPIPNPTTATLTSIFNARPRMLDRTNILLIMHKHEESTMRHHNFLTHALGAAHVSRAHSIEAAIKAVRAAEAQGRAWDWVYTHGKEKEAERAIFGSSSGGASGSHKRRSGGAQTARAIGGQGKKKTRVVGNEYVIQSLILGQLLD